MLGDGAGIEVWAITHSGDVAQVDLALENKIKRPKCTKISQFCGFDSTELSLFPRSGITRLLLYPIQTRIDPGESYKLYYPRNGWDEPNPFWPVNE